MIQLQNVRFSYPRSGFVLAIDDLTIQQGEKVAIVGPSGSGKTTMLNLICGISVAQEGSVRVLQHQVPSSDAARRHFRITQIGSIFQQFELVDYLNVRDNMLLPYWINSALKLNAAVRDRVVRLAEKTGIADKLNRRVTQLSQGEQQRVAICRAMLPEPKLILADEPTGNLDVQNKNNVLDMLFQQCDENGQTLVAVTHDTNILSGFDRTIDFEQFRRPDAGEASRENVK